MKGTLHIEAVQVVTDNTPGMIEVMIYGGGVWVNRQDFTPTPEPISKGTPVYVWDKEGKDARELRFYDRPHSESKYGHWAMRRENGADIRCFHYVRPLTAADLKGTE